MSIHIGAKEGEIASTVLLPGDPLRAKYIAENFLSDVKCYNEVRGMYGYTGNYKGKRVSVQGTGMGIPSISIYVNELIESYNVKNLIRIGTCGSMQPDINIRDVILAMSSSTDSAINRIRFNGMDYAPTASFKLLKKAYDAATSMGINVKVGNILSSDTFYNDDKDSWKLWAKFGVLAVEMETAGLYTLAAKYGVDALTILTVSDSLVTGHATSAEERQKTFNDMIKIAFEVAE
ncbi:purine-nucleoside phosphorylase [Thermoanaerobacterium thermosaccharolyticum]|jgi:purine-nucleoside phosphorylase|uniref:purine-nucleoside phosphorylase n=1 Tax=Thermoanaerobacterium thermosaccharolyticum TaxID=1517 RepID=UPI0010485B2A|nr:purine-nucleoside phosphorylase [Thermoanaerobacterium thermosaccharolyticum]MBE0069358.1 purine-nucleoside phosphorylase [Thermoanaerobacterium thermosaccharolyticum]MBE0229434.1 purine-nucleoside phosphorylase [Thermoanaerobacterium thermosaccharolyticum]TCW34802.1 purine-nucleoside phosphorylase [Thermohydrogenium kirishiense]